jgi:hypothetical protein
MNVIYEVDNVFSMRLLIRFFLKNRSLKSLVLPRFYNGPAITDFFEGTFTSNFNYTCSNVSMDTTAHSGASSRAMSVAPCDDVSSFCVVERAFLRIV